MSVCGTVWDFYLSDIQGSYESGYLDVELKNEDLLGGCILIPDGMFINVVLKA
jgi:hypothetical protein